MITIDTLLSHIGEDKMRSVVTAFYQRVRHDDLIGSMYPDSDWEGAEKRLADFLVFRFGGPQTYLQERGHPRLRMRHLPFSIGLAERDRWLQLMDEAMTEKQVPDEARPLLQQFFQQVADMMRNRPEPGAS